MNVFVFKIEKTFDFSCLPKDDENVLGSGEIIQLGDKSFTKRHQSTGNNFSKCGIPQVNCFLKDPPLDLIPSFLSFEERKKIFIKLPNCKRNEKLKDKNHPILSVGEYFVRPNDTIMEPQPEQTSSFLRSQNVPIGNHIKHTKLALSGRSIFKLMMTLFSRKRLVF